MKILVPAMVIVDNIGAILIASNITAMSHTKHMGIEYKYVNEYVEDVFIPIVFVKSTDNYSNILIKTIRAELHEKHLKKMIGEKL